MTVIRREKTNLDIEPDPDWKKKLAEVLKECRLVDEKFTGAMEISLTSGGVASAIKKKAYR